MSQNPPSDSLAVQQWLNGQRITNQRDLLTAVLDRGYDETIAPIVQAILGNSASGTVAQRLNELSVEAQRLKEAGERLTPDNPVFQQLLRDFSFVNAQNSRLMLGAAPLTLEGAVRASELITRELALHSGDFRVRYDVRWNVPDPEAVAAAVGYLNNLTGLAAEYEQDVQKTIYNQALRGIIEGWGPLRTAREIRRMVEDYPASAANNLMRTLQLTSYRDAAVVHQVANANIIRRVIRIAVLDARTCLSCIGLHGTEVPLGDRVDDHHQGRCTSVSELINFPRTIQTGRDWFENLPDETGDLNKRGLMGHANFEAYKSGRVQLRDFQQPYTDPTFGQMIREASLKGLLGAAAYQYYAK